MNPLSPGASSLVGLLFEVSLSNSPDVIAALTCGA